MTDWAVVVLIVYAVVCVLGNVKPHEVLKLINEYKADNCQLEKDNQELTSSIDHMVSVSYY